MIRTQLETNGFGLIETLMAATALGIVAVAGVGIIRFLFYGTQGGIQASEFQHFVERARTLVRNPSHCQSLLSGLVSFPKPVTSEFLATIGTDKQRKLILSSGEIIIDPLPLNLTLTNPTDPRLSDNRSRGFLITELSIQQLEPLDPVNDLRYLANLKLLADRRQRELASGKFLKQNFLAPLQLPIREINIIIDLDPVSRVPVSCRGVDTSSGPSSSSFISCLPGQVLVALDLSNSSARCEPSIPCTEGQSITSGIQRDQNGDPIYDSLGNPMVTWMCTGAEFLELCLDGECI